MSLSKKHKGYFYEDLVKEFLIKKGWVFVESNFTMRGWEIDLIFLSPEGIYVFVEVRSVDFLEDVSEYITHQKLKNLKKTIQYYMLTHGDSQKDYRLDVIFVKDNDILEHIQNVLIDY